MPESDAPPAPSPERARLRLLAAALALPLGPALASTAESLKRLQAAGGEPIGVMFPDIGEPFRKHFAEIIEGIEDATHLRAHAFPLGPDTSGTDVGAMARRVGTRVMVALGARALKLVPTLEMPVVLSGVNALPEGDKQTGISFTPDPALLFGQVKAIQPNLKRVFVVANPANADAQLRLGREAARSLSLEFGLYEARDLATAARQYEQCFGAADGRRDAIWLPHDNTTVEEATLMPIVLRESWNRAVPVFSNSFGHVKKGALFALYPNNVELGRSLANLALGMLAGEAKRGMSPLRDVLSAINTRTASHVGISLSTRQLRNFDFVYPEA
nr:ABC transporter substrate binding protein [Massilia sp. TS11]